MFALNKVFSAATILGITISTVLAAKPIEAVPSPTASTSTYVKVNLTKQSATLYKNNTEDRTFQILTGSDKNPTPTGKFKINGNRQYTPGGNNITLTGSYGTAKVGIWNPFVGNSIAFHNAPWRKEYEFGNTERRKKNGSHGCINMRYSDALYLYKNTKSGTPVYVSK
jgi:lipoprotein-anchoring transpeptidase ErfK/SrfK